MTTTLVILLPFNSQRRSKPRWRMTLLRILLVFPFSQQPILSITIPPCHVIRPLRKERREGIFVFIRGAFTHGVYVLVVVITEYLFCEVDSGHALVHCRLRSLVSSFFVLSTFSILSLFVIPKIPERVVAVVVIALDHKRKKGRTHTENLLAHLFTHVP